MSLLKTKWVKICDSFTDLVCGLLALPLDGLNRWYVCWPIKSRERPGTHGGLSFVTAWKERSVAAAVVFPHMGVVGTAKWNACVCVCHKQTPKHCILMLRFTQEPTLRQARHWYTIQRSVNLTTVPPDLYRLLKVSPLIFMLCSHICSFTFWSPMWNDFSFEAWQRWWKRIQLSG